MRTSRFSACSWPPNPPFPSLISVYAEVALRTTSRIHAGFGAVVCAEHRLAVGRNEQFPNRRPLGYDVAMQVATGTVINGKVVLEGVTLPEGALVTVLSTDTEASIKLSPAEEADLMAALDEADREAGTAAEVVLERLRKFG